MSGLVEDYIRNWYLNFAHQPLHWYTQPFLQECYLRFIFSWGPVNFFSCRGPFENDFLWGVPLEIYSLLIFFSLVSSSPTPDHYIMVMPLDLLHKPIGNNLNMILLTVSFWVSLSVEGELFPLVFNTFSPGVENIILRQI